MYLLGRELNIPLFVIRVTYALVTLTFQDPVQTGEHRMQSRLLALGVITLILGHHPDKHPWHDHDQNDLKKKILVPLSTVTSWVCQHWRDPEGSTMFSFHLFNYMGMDKYRMSFTAQCSFHNDQRTFYYMFKTRKFSNSCLKDTQRTWTLEMRYQHNPAKDKEFYWVWVSSIPFVKEK